ncbi:MAG: hypothetical protein ACI3VX_04920 [Faecousia sp.]
MITTIILQIADADKHGKFAVAAWRTSGDTWRFCRFCPEIAFQIHKKRRGTTKEALLEPVSDFFLAFFVVELQYSTGL